MIETLESYWAAELGETVDIIPVGWADSPAEYRLLIGGTDVVSYRHLEEIEQWLERYMVLEGTNVG
jgi:hypothetical protein